MVSVVQIGNVKSSPGRSVHGKFRVAERAASSVDLPLSIIQGKKEGQTLVIIAGEHGCEYSGIVAAVRLAHDLKASEISGTVIIMPLANPIAFDAGSASRWYDTGKQDASCDDFLSTTLFPVLGT